MDVSGQLHGPSALPPGKEIRYALCKRLGGPQSRSGRCREAKILWTYRLSNPVTRYCIDWAIPDPIMIITNVKIKLGGNLSSTCVLTCEVNRNCHVTTKGHELVLTAVQPELKRAVGFVDCAANRNTHIACCANNMWCFCMSLSWKCIYIAKIKFF